VSAISPADCFVCRKHRGEVVVPGGAIYEDDLVYAGHAQIRERQSTVYHAIPERPGSIGGWRMDEWPQAPRGGPAKMAAVCARIQTYLAGER